MKKNKMMRTAAGLLVATLLTTSVISGTFAKYTTSASGEDNARVATWGFDNTAKLTLDGLFNEQYTGEGNNDNVVGQADVIAPGSKNSADFTFKYSGQEATPEVAYTFTVSTNGSQCADDIKNNKNIVWSLDGTTYTTDATSTSWAKLLAAIEALDGTEGINGKQYQPGNLPTAFNVKGDNKHTVSWEWKFDENNNDTTDTNMGNKATLDRVTLKISITATQVD